MAALLGFLLVNKSGAICLTRYGMDDGDADVAAITYIPASRIAGARLTDETDEIFVDQIDDATHKALVENTRLLVVHMDESSRPLKEYRVSIEKN